MDAAKIEKQMAMMRRFVALYCRKKHGLADGEMCDECRDLLAYARQRLERCPLDPKPKCKNCHIHCYRGEYRHRVKEVMRFSGTHFIKRGRLDWLVRYFLSR